MSLKTNPSLEEALELELARGQSAFHDGNHGKARVCARRAVGMAIRAYYQQSNPKLDTTSTYKTILYMLEDDSAPEEVKGRLVAFTQHLAKDGPDQNSYWPLDIELLPEARWIISRLLHQSAD